MTSSVYRAFAAAAAMLVLILDTRTAIAGAQEGITLCVTTVIPSLFPFFVLSALLTASLTSVRHRFLAALERLLGIPAGGSALFFIGLLGGYPTGAQAVAETYRSGRLDRITAQRMLSFCSNAGPSFIFGIAAAHFSSPAAAWVLWGIQALSAALTAMLLPGTGGEVQLTVKPITLTQAFEQSLKAMVRVCGWIILFRVVIAFLNRWFLWYLDTPWQITVNGVLEMTIGCTALSYISDEDLRFILCSGLLSFGGLCVTLQTASVVQPLSIRAYLPGKLIQCAFALIMAALLIPGENITGRNMILLLMLFVTVTFFALYLKKRVAFRRCMLYNPFEKQTQGETPCSLESA